jgi:hypothetical protein
MKCPFPQVKIKLFTIFYTYIILNDYVKPYKYIFFTFTIFYMTMSNHINIYLILYLHCFAQYKIIYMVWQLHVMCHVLCLPFAVMCIVIVVSKIQYHCLIPSRRNQKVSKIQQHCFIPNWREIKKRMKFNTILSSQIGVKLKSELNSVALQLVIIHKIWKIWGLQHLI